MGSSTVPEPKTGATSDDYALISSVTPTAGSSSVNFTSISGYRKLMVVINAVTLSSSTITLRMNNDSTSKYVTTSAGAQGTFGTGHLLNTNTSTTTSVTEILNTDTTGIKIMSGTNATFSVGAYQYSIRGLYLATASVTQVNLICGTTYSGAGTIALYGVAS